MRYPLLPVLAILVGPALGAAPADAAPHAPGAASDFTQALPAARQLAEPSDRYLRAAERRKGYAIGGRVLYRTAPIAAKGRFDLVGVAGEMHALEFRARKAGGPWSPWVEAGNGDPVYTGGTDLVQIRSRGVAIEGELHFVSLPPPGPALAPGDGPRAAERGGKKPRGSVPKPKFIGRSKWGAEQGRGGCEPRERPLTGTVKAGVVHHTVSTNRYSEAEAPGMVLAICRYHRNANGWNDIGYNALVDRFGNLYEGRAGGINRSIVGAHAEGHNSQTAGIASIGTHTDDKANAATRKALIRYLAWRLDLADVPAAGYTALTSSGGASTRTPEGKRIRVPRVLSHSDTNYTECAGTALRRQIAGIRREVQERIDASGGAGTGGAGGG